MIRTDLASVMTTNSTTIAISAAMIAPPMSGSFRLVESGFDRRDGVHQGGDPADLEHLDTGARRDGQALVVRTGGPVLPVELHPARLERRDGGRQDGLEAEQRLRPDAQLGAAVQPSDDARADQRQ